MRRRWESPITPERTVRIAHPLFGPIDAPMAIHRYPGHSSTRLVDEVAFRSFGLGLHYCAYVELHDIAEAFWGRTREDGYFQLRDDLWSGLDCYGRDNDVFDLVYDRREHRIRVAHVDLREYPTRLVLDVAASWREYLEEYEDEAYYADVIERLRSLDDGTTARRPLSGTGSLFQLCELSVHPMLRGQGIGRRLIAHALWENVRQPDDLVTVQPSPISDIFMARPRMPVRTVKKMQWLVDYFERLGFHRIRRGEPVTKSDEEVMYRQVGMFGLPYAGLGSLSERAGLDARATA